MPKLMIDFDLEFEAGPFIGRSERTCADIKLSGSKLRAIVEKAKPEDFTLSVVLADSLSLEFGRTGLKKGASLEWEFDFKSSVITVRAHGPISTEPLRPGVAPFIKSLGEKADFRLRGFNYRGGKWMGFEAGVIGQKVDDYQKWIRLPGWQLK